MTKIVRAFTGASTAASPPLAESASPPLLASGFEELPPPQAINSSDIRAAFIAQNITMAIDDEATEQYCPIRAHGWLRTTVCTSVAVFGSRDAA
jgi:hypothetical protein